MKVMAINGSPNKKGCTYTAIKIIADELEKQGIEVEIMHIGNELIHGCTACGSCKKIGKCIINDIVNECIEKTKDIDGIILGSPVYYSGIAGQMKSFLDRFFYAGADLKYKVGVSVASVRRSGDVDTFQQLNNYLNLASVVLVPTQYWAAVHGMNADEVMQDKEGVQTMKLIGRNMAWLLKVIENSKEKVEMPIQENRIFTNFIR